MFPQSINIVLSDIRDGTPIDKIVVGLELYANRKNGYFFISDKSNASGEISITRTWLIERIKSEMDAFPMDYISGLDDCKPFIRIEVLGDADIQRANDAAKLWGIRQITNTNNGLYSKKEVNVDLSSMIRDKVEVNIAISSVKS